jgi:hypothetical protein
MLLLVALVLSTADKPEFRLAADGKAIEVAGVAKPDPDSLAVRVGGGTEQEVAARLPLLGEAKVANGLLRFTPRFPFTPGVTYRVTYADAKGDVTVPKVDRKPTTVVEQVYPSSKEWPENTLRVYLHFSAPMKRGGVYKHIKLYRGEAEVKYPFLELDEELWTDDGKRFTLFFDPGRVKRGLKPREELGPPLEEGKTYTLVVSDEWEDENGVKLKERGRKTFTVGKPNETAIDPEKWQILPPKLEARVIVPLEVTFDRPIDRALALRLIWVVGPNGKRVNGVASSGDDERSWFFTTRGWTAGEYRLVIDMRLEDVCGNRVGEPFEVDVFKPVQQKIEAKTVERKFTVK